MKTKVFLFPLPSTVYQPVIRKPLRIFEPRYLKMINTAVAENVPVALCYGLKDYEEGTIGIDHESLHYVKEVCGCGRPLVIDETEDGELMIILEPYKKVLIESIISDSIDYNVASVREIIDFESVMPENFLHLNQLKNHFILWSKAYFKNEDERKEIARVAEDYEVLIALFCEFIVFDPTIKQQILEFEDINDKISFLYDYHFRS